MAASTIFIHKGQSSSSIYPMDFFFFTVLNEPFPKHQFLAVRVWLIGILMANAEMAVSTHCRRSLWIEAVVLCNKPMNTF